MVGAGQAGLSVGYHLAKRDRPFLIVDANERVGDNWRRYWDPLCLYGPARLDGCRVRSKFRSDGGPLLRDRGADLAAAGVERVTARAAGVRDGLPQLDDGRALDVANVICCTGFKQDFGRAGVRELAWAVTPRAASA